MMPGAAFLGGYADVRLDAQGDVLNHRVNFESGSLLLNDVPMLPFGEVDSSDFARLSLPNVFTRETTLSGVRLGLIKVISSDYLIMPTDGVILVDCTGANRTLTLPFATGTGQLIRIRKTDQTENFVTVTPQTGDFIDTFSSIVLDDFSRGMMVSDVQSNFWDMTTSPFIVDSNARNVFTDLTTLAGVRFAPPKMITEDGYVIEDTDFEILMDCSVNDTDLNIFLPLSNGNGRLLHIKKYDRTARLVRIRPQAGDLIDGSNMVSFGNPLADILLCAGAGGYWDNMGPANILIIPDPPPATPTTTNQIVALLQFYGLCA